MKMEHFQGCSKTLRQPGNEPFELGKNNELYHKSGINFKFLTLLAGQGYQMSWVIYPLLSCYPHP